MSDTYPPGLKIDMDNVNSQQVTPLGVLVDGVPVLYPPFGDHKQWKVGKTADTSVFRYISKEGWLVFVEEDMLSDLASLPQLLRSIFGVNKKESVAAIYHDKLYRDRMQVVSNVLQKTRRCLRRGEVDKIFYDLMKLGGVSWIRRHLFYRGLRLGGWWRWYRYGKVKGLDLEQPQ
jgi:hypothetical protein